MFSWRLDDKPEWILLTKELRSLLNAPILWAMLAILYLLVGYNFIHAVNLYSTASQIALKFPELAKTINPLDRILVPTFNALYLTQTLLFPFVAFGAIAMEKQRGFLKLLLQLPLGITKILIVKILALTVVWFLTQIPILVSLLLWTAIGGHIYMPELINLRLGYALYAFAIVGIAFFAAAVTKSTVKGAIVIVAFILFSWGLDFLTDKNILSLSAPLRQFESGLFASSSALLLFIAGSSLLTLSGIWLSLGKNHREKLQLSTQVMGVAIAILLIFSQFPIYSDVSENRRNSFNIQDEIALRQMKSPLNLTVYLSPNDTRLGEFEEFLTKLRRTVPRMRVNYTNPISNDQNGLIIYEYGGKRDARRSYNAREILPLLHRLAGKKVTATSEYRGYPLVANAKFALVWLYWLLPGLFMAVWWYILRSLHR